MSKPTKTTGKNRFIPLLAVTLVTIILPILVIGLLEIALTLTDYGVRANPFEESAIRGSYVLNSDYPHLFSAFTKSPIEDPDKALRPVLFSDPKPEGVFRIFVLGGSSAQGFPFQGAHSFTGIAGALLNTKLQNGEVEVINLAASAMSSYYIQEVSRHIWKYEPDLVLIYAGHNEYYGTIGAGSGRGHLGKLIYVKLKNLRTFQLLFNIINGNPEKQGSPSTMMEDRLAAGQFPQDENTDRIIAERFIDNLEQVRRQSARHNIPLVVMDPVSNLITMPPFNSTDSADLQQLIKLGEAAVIQETGNKAEWEAAIAADARTQTNAHLLYLLALEQGRTGNWNYSLLAAAKDADTVPFRAREILRAELEKWAEQNSNTVHYIPLAKELYTTGGAIAFSDFYFIDHLHFNLRGQMVVGRILADHLIEATESTLHLPAGSWPYAETFKDHIFFHPALETYMLLTMSSLFDGSPWKDMIIKYDAPGLQATFGQNKYLAIPSLRAQILERPAEALGIISEYLVANEMWEDLTNLLNAMVYINPGSYRPYLNLASFLDSAGFTNIQILNNYQRAWLLSGRDGEVRTKMDDFAKRAGFTDEIKQFYATAAKR